MYSAFLPDLPATVAAQIIFRILQWVRSQGRGQLRWGVVMVPEAILEKLEPMQMALDLLMYALRHCSSVIIVAMTSCYPTLSSTGMVDMQYLTLGAHLVCQSFRPSVCPVPLILPLRATRRPKSDTNGFSATLA